jgi:acetyltransferase-like isoleucine patch superfamily enzyme
MDKNSMYVKDIQSRTKAHFFIGVLARLKKYYINKYAVFVARNNGASIGRYVSIPLSLARKANSNLTIGDHSSIQSNKLDLRAPLTIGSYVIIGGGVEIITCSHNVDSPDWEHKSYGLVIEDYVWLATKVLVLPSCREIKKGAILAAGSVTAKKVDPMQIMAGNPAVLLRERKEVHYNLCVEGLLGNDLKTYLKVRRNQLD